jgi:hypothetical protein
MAPPSLCHTFSMFFFVFVGQAPSLDSMMELAEISPAAVPKTLVIEVVCLSPSVPNMICRRCAVGGATVSVSGGRRRGRRFLFCRVLLLGLCLASPRAHSHLVEFAGRGNAANAVRGRANAGKHERVVVGNL